MCPGQILDLLLNHRLVPHGVLSWPDPGSAAPAPSLDFAVWDPSRSSFLYSAPDLELGVAPPVRIEPHRTPGAPPPIMLDPALGPASLDHPWSRPPSDPSLLSRRSVTRAAGRLTIGQAIE